MITFEEAMVLQAVRMNPMSNKSELLTLLSDGYRVNMNRAHLSALIDKLDTIGYLAHMERLPRVYFVSPDTGFNALVDFNCMVAKYNNLLALHAQRIETIKETKAFKDFIAGQ